MNYPSRKVLIAGILAAAAVGGWFYFAKIYQPKPKTAAPKSLETLVFNEKGLRDDDNDGLKNWEEALWQTDPNNPDTDRDGTPDGEEIKLKRDPRKPGPDDELTAALPTEKQVSQEIDLTKVNMTDEFAGAIIQNAVPLTQGGSVQALADNLAESVLSAAEKIIALDPFSLKDLKISQDNSRASKELYINNLVSILRGNFANVSGTEIQILQEALEKEEAGVLKQLDEYYAGYAKTINQLLVLGVPSDYAPAHLHFLNTLENTKNAISLLQIFPDDPIKGLMGVNIYLSQAKRIDEFVKAMGRQLAADGLEFLL